MIKRGRVNRCLKPALWTADFHLNAYFSDSLAFVRKDRYSWDWKPNITALNLSIIDSYFFLFQVCFNVLTQYCQVDKRKNVFPLLPHAPFGVFWRKYEKKTCLRGPFRPSSNYIVYPRDNESLVNYERVILFKGMRRRRSLPIFAWRINEVLFQV